MIALLRYVVSSCLHAQRWVAPILAFVLGLVVTYATGGAPLPTLAEGATWLFPITAWLTVATLNDEDPSQTAITAAAGGGIGRVRFAKLLVATGAGLGMTMLSLAATFALGPSRFTLNDLAIGGSAHVLAVVGGVTLGSCCARPLVNRNGWAVLTILVVAVTDLVIPHAPPARVDLAALGDTQAGQQWGSLASAAAEVALVAVVFIVGSSYLSRIRS